MNSDTPPEILDLFVECLASGLLSPDFEERQKTRHNLRACTKSSRLLWHLARRRLFRDVYINCTVEEGKLTKSFHRMLDLMSDSTYPIIPLIASFGMSLTSGALEVIDEESTLSLTQEHCTSHLAQMLTQLAEHGTFSSVFFGAAYGTSLWWDAVHPILKTSVQKILCLNTVHCVQLKALNLLPPGFLLGTHIHTLHLNFCSVDPIAGPRTQTDQPIHNPPPLAILAAYGALCLPLISVDEEEFDGLTSKHMHPPLTHIAVAYRFVDDPIIAKEEVARALELSSQTLREFNLRTGLKLELNDVDLSRHSCLRRLGLTHEYMPAYHFPCSEFISLCEQLLQSSRPNHSLETLRIQFLLEYDLAPLRKIDGSLWKALDNVISHSHYTSIRCVQIVIYHHRNTLDPAFLEVEQSIIKEAQSIVMPNFPSLSVSETVQFELKVLDMSEYDPRFSDE